MTQQLGMTTATVNDVIGGEGRMMRAKNRVKMKMGGTRLKKYIEAGKRESS